MLKSFKTKIPPGVALPDAEIHRAKVECYRTSAGDEANCNILGYWNAANAYTEILFATPFQNDLSDALSSSDTNATDLNLTVTCAYANAGSAGSPPKCSW